MTPPSPFCPHCSAPVFSMTCITCGKSVLTAPDGGSQEPPAPPGAGPSGAAAGPAPVRMAKRVVEPPRRVRTDDEPPRGMSPTLVFGIIGGFGFLMLAFAGAAAYFVFGRVAPNDQAANTPPTAVSPAPEPPSTAPAATKPLPENSDAVKRVKKSTVFIKVSDWSGGKWSGSGFFAGEKGYVLTNAHVVGYGPSEVRKPAKIEVIVNSGAFDQRTLVGTLFGVDADRDLALLKVSSDELPPPLTLKPAAGLKETDDLVIFGYPFGEALGKSISVNTTTVSGLPREDGELKHVQVNGGMHPGNSGGPVTNKAGDVVGVSVAGIRGTQINFAIPGEKAEAFVREQIDSGGEVNLGKLAANTTTPKFNPNPNPNPFPPAGDPFPRPNPRPNPRPVNPDADKPRDAMKLPPVVPVDITPAPIPGEKVEVKLPSAVADVCVGGGGRYVCLLLPKTRQVAVFDVSAGKVVKYFPVAADDVRIAAGMNKLVVLTPEPGMITRYDFAKLEKDVTAPAPFSGALKTVAMGSASAGPLLVNYGKGTGALDAAPVILIDPNTMKEVRVGADDARAGMGGHVCYRDMMHYRASPDGTVFGAWCTSHSPGGLTSILVGGDAIKSHYAHESVGHVVPGPDGTLFTGGGLYTSGLKKLGKADQHQWGRFTVPATSGNLYLDLSPEDGNAVRFPGRDDKTTMKANVRMLGDDRPIVTLPKIELSGAGEAWAGHDFSADKRIVFVPEAKAVVVVPGTNDKLVVYKFDMEAALEKAGIDYLFVSSRPPVCVPGKAFDYPIVVRCKKGGVKYKLESGPDGMKVAPDGKVTWAPAADWVEPHPVIITVSDATGQEIFHTFNLTPGKEQPKAVVAPKPEPKPDPKPEPKPDPKPEPKPEPKPDPKPDPKPEPKPDPKQEPKPEPKPEPEPAETSKDIIQSPTTILPIKTTDAQDGATVNLPGTVDAVCVAGGGRFLVYRIPKARQLALFDVTLGKVAKYVPLAEDNALFAGGMNKLFVLNPTANVIQRWDLAKLEKESTVANPVGGTPKQILVGHQTDGPLYIGGPGVGEKHRSSAFVNPKTWKEVEVPVQGGRGGPAIGDSYPPLVRISPDGRVFAWWTPGLSPSGLSSMVIGSKEAKCYNEHTSVGGIMPGPDGNLFTGGGIYSPELKKLSEKSSGTPAVSGPWYLEFKLPDRSGLRRPGTDDAGKAAQVTLKMLGDGRPLVTLTDLPGLDVETDQHGWVKAGSLAFADRVQLIPEADLLVVLNSAGTKLHLHRFDLKGRLAKSDIDYLLVMSRPPAAAVRGAKFSYTPNVWSKKGGVKIKVDAGPDGMKATNGTVTWDVPADAAEETLDIILTVADATGQETFHSFKLTVKNKGELPKP